MGKFYLNKVILVGDVCTDVNYSVTREGTSKAYFTLAVARDYDKNVKDFIPITAFNHIAEFATDHLLKGASVCIEGSIRLYTVSSPKGTKYYTNVLADTIDIVTRKMPPKEQTGQQLPIDPLFGNDDDDLPF